MSDSFPTHCYRSPGPHAGPPVDGKSTTYECLGVSDADGLAAALAAGWFTTLPEAVGLVAPKPRIVTSPSITVESPTTPLDVAPPTRAELDKQALALGLKKDHRTSDADLAKKIAESIARAPHLESKG